MHEAVPAPLVDDGSSRLLLATARVAWDDAAMLATLSLLLLIVSSPFVMLASLIGWPAVWAPMVLVTAPFWFATVNAADRLLDLRGVSLRDLPGSIRHGARTAWLIGIVPAVFGTIALGVLELIGRNPEASAPRLVLPPALGVLAAVAVLIGPAFAAGARYDTGAGTAWRLGARIVVTKPVQQIGLVACFGLLLWLTVAVGPVVLLALGPFALLSVAVARVQTGELERPNGGGQSR
jgi:hypothetical protein